MTISLSIREPSCRGCELCADICPTKVLALEASSRKMRVVGVGDCIGCLSCALVCPSGSLTHVGVPRVKDFARNLRITSQLRRHL